MNAIRKAGTMSPSKITTFRFFRQVHTTLIRTKTEKAKESVETFDFLNELKEPELTEEEILKKRFKSRLPERIYRKFVQKEALPIEAEYDFQDYRLRGYYARHGKASKLNPGICWPTREQILETIEYDKIFEPTLQERLQNVETTRQEEEKRKRDVEAEVDRNMANLDKWMSEYHARIEKKKNDALELKKKRERLIEEISEYLGYDIDPRDPRFQEAVEQREKEKKKALKAKKQEESYEKMLTKLKEIAKN